jgi:alpha-mannosidase
VDISNARYGVTWVTADAPLVELGGLTANLPRSQPNPNAYLKTIKPSATLYSWAMNNHWHTNYRAEQEGPTVFRYAIHPHREYNAADAMRFGVESTEPLVAAPAVGVAPRSAPVRIEPTGVLATAFKPADDGKAWIIRLFNASAKPQAARLIWTKPAPRVSLSDASEQERQLVGRSIPMPPWGLVTVRADRP